MSRQGPDVGPWDYPVPEEPDTTTEDYEDYLADLGFHGDD